MLSSIFSSLQNELISLVITILGICISWATKHLVSYLKKKNLVSQLEAHKHIVEVVVKFVEQVYKDFDGKDKLKMAKFRILEFANAHGLKISEKELDLLIEAAVKDMKGSVGEISSIIEQSYDEIKTNVSIPGTITADKVVGQGKEDEK